MHGLVFVTWEKYLAERFGNRLFQTYRETIGEDSMSSPLVSKVYDDTQLLAGVGAACQLTGLPSNVILRDYGRYFILNGLTNHLCAYLLSRVHSGKELLLVMRNAHAQMRRVPEALTPPLFGYEPMTKPDQFILVYDSPRQLCPLLYGAIEGAAERFQERVTIIESSCMKRGDATCRFELSFQPTRSASARETHEQARRRYEKQVLADQVLHVLPEQDGIELGEIQQRIQQQALNPKQSMPRLSAIQEAINHLQFVGLAASSANQPGENVMHRRYWRAPTDGTVSHTGFHDLRSSSARTK
ncbi:heme NO-binding domain-containing protein [Ktedonospora formicarum]|uniref:Heme NO-binding domain-containing protein n=1 Tax=Ktedonospora formicarum TaxID=2778364 RepID=A0A8J3MRX7_9CHLR|nr:heme NO-binding domain-containing protein [Ktedonospora formicarum]GHO45490.1 hypothetical protein KSX_36530 [Ktedonospora formicarum]